MRLLSYEIKLLAHYIQQSEEQRAAILRIAENNPKLSGDLIQAYRKVEDIL